MKTILSIDGGGIRGLIPAIVLEALESRLRAAGLEGGLCRHFDLVAGTSTGGIIAAALTCPHPDDRTRPAAVPSDLVRLYLEDGPVIFRAPSRWRRLRTLIGGARHDAQPLERMLQAKLGPARLSDARTGLMLTAYDIDARRAVFMTNTPGDEEDYLAWQAARATAAAPTYFVPAQVEARCATGPRLRTLVDGGVFVNDPVFSAFVEARKYGHAADALHVLSIGTGYATRPYRFDDVRRWGLFNWIDPTNATPIISIMMHGQASSAAYMAEKLLNRDPERPRYVRIDMALDAPAKDELDDTSDANLRALEDLARACLATTRVQAGLDRVVAWLRARADAGPA